MIIFLKSFTFAGRLDFKYFIGTFFSDFSATFQRPDKRYRIQDIYFLTF